MSIFEVDPAELAKLDAAIDLALRSGDESQLDVLGYGEISSVIRYSFRCGDLACKRLPLFDTERRFKRYRDCFNGYLSTLRARGVNVLSSSLAAHVRADGRIAGYCLQPALAGSDLATSRLSAMHEPEDALALFESLFDGIFEAVSDKIGLDGQLSNWVLVEGKLAYLDVTTPLMRDDAHQELLDGELFLASLPWALRRIVRKFMLQGVLETYYQPRSVIVDLLANLYKERLGAWIPHLLPRANARDIKPISEPELRAYYKSDARTWAILQRLRHADRYWQRTIRRRPYPFLLPGPIDRGRS